MPRLALAVIGLLLAAPVAAGVMPIRSAPEPDPAAPGPRPFVDHLVHPDAPPEPFRRRADLLRPEDGLLGAAQAGVDTLRFALIRVDFATVSEPDSFTGDGRFDLRTGVFAPVDPPPHDRGYFEAHIEALRRFYDVQSHGTLVIETTLFPPGEGAYTLGDPVGYGPWDVSQDDSVIARAERFTGDALRAAANSGDLVASDFDGFGVVHAGADFQGDVDRNSPYDIPSFTIRYGEPLDVGTGTVDRCLVIPEYTSQDGLLGALNGVFAHEFGHVLGLPDLYNVFGGAPQVGWWSLMDSGDNLRVIVVDPDTEEEFEVRGVFPTSLDPWCKLQVFPNAAYAVEAGEVWQEAVEATEVDPRVPLAAIDPLEYFLFENRALDLDGNGGALVQQDPTGVFLGPGIDSTAANLDGAREYDAVLPEGGILIWRIDDRINLSARGEAGVINLGLGDRGVAVEEADGISDLGQGYSRFPYGHPLDPWYEGSATVFGPHTVPSTDSKAGDASGITVTVSGVPARTMGLRIERAFARDGWPRVLNASAELAGSALVDVTGDGTDEFLFSFTQRVPGPDPDLHGILAVRGDGTAYPSDTTAWALGGTTFLSRRLVTSDAFRFPGANLPATVVATVDAAGNLLLWDQGGGDPRLALNGVSLRGPAALVPRGDDPSWIVAPTRDAVIAFLGDGTEAERVTFDPQPILSPSAGPVVLRNVRFADSTSVPVPVAVGAAMAFRTSLRFGALSSSSPGAQVEVDLPGSVRFLAAGPLTVQAEPVVVAVGDSTAWVVSALDGILATLPLPDLVQRPPVIADVDGDGLAEVVLGLRDGGVYAFNGDGSPAVGWPQAVPAGPIGFLAACALDDDDFLDVLALDADGRIHAWGGRGRPLADFPRSVGPFTPTDARIGDLDGDGRLTWATVVEEGALLARRLPGAARPGDWRMDGGNPEGTGQGGEHLGGGPLAGRPELGEGQLLVYPNPAVHADVEIRFTLDPGERAEITFIDVSGRERPADLDFRGGPQVGENAVLWRVADVPPGLYYCRLERNGPGGRRVETAPVAVLR